MSSPIVLLGEALVNLSSSADRPLDRGASLDVAFAGAEVNVAIGLARLRHSARWVSVVGDDPFGKMVLRGLRGEGVDVSAVQVHPTAPTALMVKCPRPGAEPEVLYYRKGSGISLAGPDTFGSGPFQDAGALYLTGITPALSDGCRQLVDRVISEAFERGVPIWFDPNHRRKLWSDDLARETILPWLPKFHVILTGMDEGQMLTGETDPATMAARFHECGVPRVVIKDGAQGSWYFTPEGKGHVPAFPISRIVDAVGAGDAFGAGVLSARQEGLGWAESLQRGSALGAICCLTRGDWEGAPNQGQLDDFLSNRQGAVR